MYISFTSTAHKQQYKSSIVKKKNLLARLMLVSVKRSGKGEIRQDFTTACFYEAVKKQ